MALLSASRIDIDVQVQIIRELLEIWHTKSLDDITDILINRGYLKDSISKAIKAYIDGK